jgi:hypothetical protein
MNLYCCALVNQVNDKNIKSLNKLHLFLNQLLKTSYSNYLKDESSTLFQDEVE